MTRSSSRARPQATWFARYADAASTANLVAAAPIAAFECVSVLSMSGERTHTSVLSAPIGLFVGDGGASGLEGLASLVCSLLVDLLQNGFGGGLDQVLGLLEPKAGE